MRMTDSAAIDKDCFDVNSCDCFFCFTDSETGSEACSWTDSQIDSAAGSEIDLEAGLEADLKTDL